MPWGNIGSRWVLRGQTASHTGSPCLPVYLRQGHLVLLSAQASRHLGCRRRTWPAFTTKLSPNCFSSWPLKSAFLAFISSACDSVGQCVRQALSTLPVETYWTLGAAPWGRASYYSSFTRQESKGLDCRESRFPAISTWSDGDRGWDLDRFFLFSRLLLFL